MELADLRPTLVRIVKAPLSEEDRVRSHQSHYRQITDFAAATLQLAARGSNILAIDPEPKERG
jgi:hypothetical protein